MRKLRKNGAKISKMSLLINRLIIGYFCSIVLKTNSQTINYRTVVTEELINLLETAFCSDKPDSVTCNAAEGKVCSKSKCVNACSSRNLAPCSCPLESRCNLCCGSARSSCNIASIYNITDVGGTTWVRQNSLDSCGPTTRPTLSVTVCPANHNGKICDLTPKEGMQIEEPWICNNGQCTKLMCNVFNMPTQIGKTIVNCGCRDGYQNYPVCCTDLTNGTCYPFQMWIRAPQGRGYIDAIGVKQGTIQSTVASLISTTIDPNLDLRCSAVDSDGKKCDSIKWCSGGHCQHPCLDPNRECSCSPESDNECDICCFNGEGICISSNLNSSRPIFFQPVIEECDYGYGRCTVDGACVPAIEHPLASIFCHHPINEGKPCGDLQMNFVCRNKSCVHVCGSEADKCICNHETEYECRVCCKNSTGFCDLATANTSIAMVRQPVGVSCDHGLGVCNAQGTCELLPSYCSSSISHENKKCGSDKVCRRQRCVHVCGNSEKQCICPEGTNEECHICCKDQNGSCSSANVNITEPSNRFVRMMGTSCNFTMGQCSNVGDCEPVKGHPWSEPFCNKMDNNAKRCDRREGYFCDNFTCVQACQFPDEPCICPPSSNHECHACCRNSTSSQCRTIVVQADAKPRFRAQGMSCDSGQGTCDAAGMCNLLPNFCSDARNKNKKCGEDSICYKGECLSVCGNMEVCICDSGTDDNQCKTCCFNQSKWSCEPAFFADVPAHLLARPFGTVCTIGSVVGSCTYNGSCTVSHNLLDGKSGRCNACHFGINFALLAILFTFCIVANWYRSNNII